MKRKQITTTFKEDLLKNMKMLALDLECNVNDLLEFSYEYMCKQLKPYELKEKFEKYKEEK